MNSEIIKNIIRFVLLVLIQVLALKGIQLDYGFLSHGMFFIYPLFIILLPINIPRTLLLLLAFVLGISIDIFYDSLGVHAATTVFLAFVRMYVLRFLEPNQGYKTEGSPSALNLGLVWFVSYASCMLFLHLFIYFSIDAFSFVFIFDIIIKTILSFIFSIILLIIHQIIFKVN